MITAHRRDRSKAAVGRRGIRVTGRTGLPDNIALDGNEGREIGAALQIIYNTAHALPRNRDVGNAVGG